MAATTVVLSTFLLFFFFFFAATATDMSMKEKRTHVRFFLHDKPSSPNPTAIKVVRGPSNASFLNFGDTVIIDDALTVGPRRSSKLVGRAQGLFTQSELGQVPAIFVAMSVYFVSGEYSGSTIVVVGRNPYTEKLREFPIVGGTGYFRLARGYIQSKTYMVNYTNGDSIHQYDAYVLHY